MIYILQDLTWFKENAFEDHDGDFWEIEADRDNYNKETEDVDNDEHIIYSDEIGRIYKNRNNAAVECFSWGVKTIKTKEENPEYFL